MTETLFEPFSIVNAAGDPSILLVCDHASNAVPPAYADLGLPAMEFERHIAYDIGAADLTRHLATLLNAPAILAGFSRLLIDANRGADDPTLVMRISDGAVIPGNARADDKEIARRLERFHRPYHSAIAAQIAGARAKGFTPAIVSIHSFTPAWKGVARPWSYGVLWDKDDRIARPLLQRLRGIEGIVVGDNEPYSGELENDCLNIHGTRNGLPHVLIEIRQDLIDNTNGVGHVAQVLADILKPILADPATRQAPAPYRDPALEQRLEAAAFRRLLDHLRERADVQNIDLMGLAGFCRNCLGDWYAEAAAAAGLTLTKVEARTRIYGMAPEVWKALHQKPASPEQLAKFDAAHRQH